MSIVAPEQQTADQPQTTPLRAPPPIGVRPSIVANRRLLTRRFASLAFTVSTHGLPFWEVFAFTDRSLIDPANASRRTPANFYSSRQDGGMRRASSTGDDIFLLPSAVLRGFAAATPKPTAIYYTIAAYATADGSSPAFPEPPQQLVLAAPSVAVSPDFTPDTVDSILGVRSNRLQVVAQALDADVAPQAQAPAAVAPATVPAAPAPVPPVAAAPAPTAQTPAAPAAPPATQQPAAAPMPAAAPAPPLSAEDDAAAGEDGCSYYRAHPEILVGESTDPSLVASRPNNGEEPYDDGYGAYDAGWGSQTQSWEGVLESPFPEGFPEPAALVDQDAEGGWSAESAAELGGVATAFPYRGLDESAAQQPGSSGDAAVASPDAPAATAAPAVAPPRPLTLTIDDKVAIIEKVAGSESGADRYSAINADGEYKGRFGPNHPAYHRYHIGLSYGIIQCTQESGNLGGLLQAMLAKNDALLRQTFGAQADELIRVTNATGPPSSESDDGRSARTQPVDGADLWEEPWISRFRQAGQIADFQSVQNEYAAKTFLDPMVRFAGDLGLDTDRALTMVVDRAVQMGVQGARHWIIAAVGPISTPALRQQALAALNFTDLASFQRAYGLDADNLWGPLTHAALVGALRQLGSGSPIPLPTLDQMLDAMVRRAEADNAFWAGRVKRLRTATGFADQAYAR